MLSAVALLLALASFFVGWLLGDTTLGFLLMGAALLMGIFARINQAEDQHKELMALLGERAE